VSTTPAREYEFNQDQNATIGGLAARMRGVGLLLILLAIFCFLFTVIVVLVIYRAKLPQQYVDKVLTKVSEVAKTDVKDYLTNQLPSDTHLWGIAIFGAVTFLIYLLVGIWLRQASGGFQQIVTTEGRDISHLMRALSALNRMFSLVYTLMAIGLILLLVAIGYFIYTHIAR
jgi:hypothetical protein